MGVVSLWIDKCGRKSKLDCKMENAHFLHLNKDFFLKLAHLIKGRKIHVPIAAYLDKCRTKRVFVTTIELN